MFKILLNKQFNEMFSRILYNNKTKKYRSFGAGVVMLFLYAWLIFGIVGGAVGYAAYMLCQPFKLSDMGWMYFLLMGMTAILIGAFGTIFSTYSSLYLSKDNDLLVSLPIPTRSIIMARLTSVYIMGFAFSGIVTIPSTIIYWVVIEAAPLNVICSVIYILIISFIVFLLSCILGFLVAKIASRAKNQSNVTVAFSLIFTGVYYLVYSLANEIISGLINNVVFLGQSVKKSLYPMYMFGRIGEGDVLSTVIYTVITAVLVFVVYRLLARSFVTIVTASKTNKKVVYKEKAVKRKSQVAAVAGKEFKRYTSSGAYMLNSSMGTLCMIICSVLFIVKGDFLQSFNDIVLSLDIGMDGLNNMDRFIPIIVVTITCFLISLNNIVVPSVSLEGKNIWIMQSLPIEPWTVLKGKLMVHLTITGVPLVILLVSFLFAVKVSVVQLLIIYLTAVVYLIFMSLFGLFLAVKMPNLTWTNEMTPVKQGGGIMISLFGGVIFSILIAICYFLLGLDMACEIYLLVVSAVFVIVSVLLYIWIKNKGAKIFSRL